MTNTSFTEEEWTKGSTFTVSAVWKRSSSRTPLTRPTKIPAGNKLLVAAVNT